MLEPIEIVETQAIYTAVIPDRVPLNALSRFVPAACGEVWNFVKSAGLPDPGRHMALYLDAEGTVEVGVEVTEAFAGKDKVLCSQLPAGRAVHVVHFGPYPGLREAHAVIRRWFGEQDCAGTGVSWEIYGHWEAGWDKEPAKIRSDVFYLL